MSDFTQIVSQIQAGDASAADQLLPLVYQELRQLAAAKMRQERPGMTLQPTALVHEAYVRLVEFENAQRWDNRRHFFAAAAEAMRRILIEQARRKGRKKHGGEFSRVGLQEQDVVCTVDPDVLLDIDDALSEFEQVSPDKAQLVKLRFFGGLTLEEAADTLNLSRTTAQRHWTFARAWLYRRMQGHEPPP